MYLLNPRNNSPRNKARSDKGLAFLLTVLGLGTIMTTFAVALLSMTIRAYQTTSQVTDNTTAFSLAEQGLDYAVSQLNANPSSNAYNCASTPGTYTTFTVPSSITNNTNANVSVNVSCPGNPPNTSSIYDATLDTQFPNSYRMMTATVTMGGTTRQIQVLLQPIVSYGNANSTNFPYVLFGVGSVMFSMNNAYYNSIGNYVTSYNVPTANNLNNTFNASIGTQGTVACGYIAPNNNPGFKYVLQGYSNEVCNLNCDIYEYISNPNAVNTFVQNTFGTQDRYYPALFGGTIASNYILKGSVYSNCNYPTSHSYWSWPFNTTVQSTTQYYAGNMPLASVPVPPGAPSGTPGASNPPDLYMVGATLIIDDTAPAVQNMSWTNMKNTTYRIPPGNYAFNSVVLQGNSSITITSATQTDIANGVQPPVKFFVSGHTTNIYASPPSYGNTPMPYYSVEVDQSSSININGISLLNVWSQSNNVSFSETAGSASQFQLYDSATDYYIGLDGQERMVLYAPYSSAAIGFGASETSGWFAGSLTAGAFWMGKDGRYSTGNNLFIGYDYNLSGARTTSSLSPTAQTSPLLSEIVPTVTGYRAVSWREL